MNIAMDISIMVRCHTGTEEYTEGLIWGLYRNGVAVIGIGRHGEAVLPDRPCLGLQPRTRRSPWEKLWWERSGIRRAIRPDIQLVHIPYMTHPPRPFRIPSVVTVHDLIPFRMEGYQARVRERAYFSAVKRNLYRATHLVAISEATRRDIESFLPSLAHKVTVIPNGIHPAFFAPPDSEALTSVVGRFGLSRQPRVLYLGGYDSRKNVETLVQAAARLFQRHDGELVLVGAAGNESLGSAIQAAGIRDRVIATPFVDRDDLVALYHTADVFAYPSLYEGFGMPPAQALAAGVAVVASDIPPLREVAGEGAVFVDPKSVDAWTDALADVIDNPARAGRLGAAGRARAQDFGWETIARRYEELYARLVNS